MSLCRRLNFITVAALILLCATVFSSQAQTVDQPRRNPARELIVKLRPGTPFDTQRALRNAKTTRELGHALPRLKARETGSTLLLTVRDDVSIGSELARLSSNPAVEYVEPNYRLKLLDTVPGPVLPNDFDFSNMYALLNTGGTDAKTNADIHATEAWRYTTGDKKVIVAVIDTGIDYLHEDLRDNIWTNDKEIPNNGIDDDGNGLVDDYMGYDFVSNDSDPFDDNQHGTHVAGIIGAKGNNGIGTVGVNWNVSLMALKAFDDQGNGTVDAAIAAIEYAVANGARIINGSWGLDEKSRALEDAIQKAADAGVLFVAAAGNNRSDAPSYPASFDSVLSVGATDKRDIRAVYSNYGPTVDIAAPGDAVFSTLPENNYGFLSGTSMSAPHVSGTAALVLSLYPDYSRQELFDILVNSVDPVLFDQPMGNGRLNASMAVQMDRPLPSAKLSVPATVSGTIDVTGMATGLYTTGYGMFIGSGKTPTNWAQVASSTTRITNGLLAQIDTSIVPDGPAVVQLVVTNSNGATATVNGPVKVLNAMVSSPMAADVLAPGKFDLSGTFYGANKRFEISFGPGLHPSSWTSIGQGNQSVLDGKVGEWDASTLPTGLYSLRMVSITDTNQTEFLSPAIYVDHHFRSGWPVRLPTDSDFPVAEWRNIRVADLDGDGKSEIIVVEPGTPQRQQTLMVFSLDGQLLWSRDLGFDIPPDVPAIGDIDGDGKMEIFVDVPDGVTAFHYDGSPVAGWPVKKTTRNQAKVLADLNGDGQLEVITYSQEYSATQVPDMRELAVYTSKGSLIRKWQLPWCGSTNDVQKIFPAVANIDDDPELEIVAVSGCSEIAAFDYRQDAPKWRATGEGIFLSSPVIGDIDGDGSPDIVVASAAANDAPTGGVYVFRGNGQRWPGWPVLEQYSFEAAPALGDLDHDGRLEIVLVSTKPHAVHVLQSDGFEADGWPIDELFDYGSPRIGVSLADINGDGTSEILMAVPGFLSLGLGLNDTKYVGGVFAYNFQGQVVPFNGTNAIPCLPIESFSPYRTHKSTPPIIGDFDGDGRLDMANASVQERTYGTDPRVKNRSSVYNWILDATNSARALEWPMFAHDVQNRGTYTLPPFIIPPATNVTGAIRDRVLALEDHILEIHPLNNDLGVAPLQLVDFTQPAHGSISLSTNSDSTLLYQPEKFYSGFDEFTYTMKDATGASSSAKVFIRLKSVNNAPIAQDIHLSMKKNGSISIFYNATDPENDPLTFRILDTPAHGELWSYPTMGEYYPKRGFFGTDTVHYVANDGQLDSDPATITIDVINSNNPPVLDPQTFLTKTNRSLIINPAATDLDNDDVTLQLVTPPQNGIIAPLAGGGFRYTPRHDFLGDDSIVLQPFDGTALGDPATMTISVIATNASPVASNGSASISPDVPFPLVLPGRDPDGDQITFTILTQPLHGTLTGTPPKMTYMPDTNYLGPDKFTYKVSDGFAETPPATYTITVVRKNHPPDVQDQSISTITGVPVHIALDMHDADGDPIRTVILKGPAKGLLYGTGTNFTYVPNPGTLGPDSFTYKGWDGQKFSKVAKVSLNVSLPREDLPPTFAGIQVSNDGILISIDQPNTRAFFLEVSTNLVDWATLGGPFVPQDTFTYKETNTTATARFYRARRKD